MGKRGPKPKPTAAKRLAGNPGKRPLNDAEPQYDGAPKMPDHLPAEAKAEWKRRVPEMARQGVVTDHDAAVLCAYCEAWARYVKASKNVQQYGEVIVSPKTNTPYASPYLHIQTAAEKQMVAYAAELGLTPSARSRVTATGPDNNDPILELLRRRGSSNPARN
jgi:P27 family predicted phage terminase small subunit